MSDALAGYPTTWTAAATNLWLDASHFYDQGGLTYVRSPSGIIKLVSMINKCKRGLTTKMFEMLIREFYAQ